MTKNEFKQAVEMVEKGEDLSKFDDSNLYGCGLPDFKPREYYYRRGGPLGRMASADFCRDLGGFGVGQYGKDCKKEFLNCRELGVDFLVN